MATVDGGRLVVDALKREGVEYIFSLSGGHINSIYQACLDSGIQVIDTRHEQAAAHMAEAWGRLTGKPGVCVVTAGPGFTDAVTGVANACQASSPMLVISGRSGVSETETLALQELEQIDIIRPLIKWGRVVYQTHRLDEFTAMAFRHGMTGRPGPVFLEIPVDVMNQQVEESQVVRAEGYRPRYRPAGSEEGIAQALDLLRQAERPAVIAGSGAHFAGAAEELEAFAQLTDLPVFTSNMGQGLLADDDPHWFGSPMVGLGTLSTCDVVLLLGGRLGLFMGQGRPPFIAADAKLIQVDVEGSEIGRNRRVDVGITGDVKEILKQMIEQVRERPFSHSKWLDSTSDQARQGRRQLLASAPGFDKEEPIHPARLMHEIREFLDDDAVIAADGGDTQVELAPEDVHLDATVLRHALLRDLHRRHDFDAADDRRLEAFGRTVHLVQHTIDAVAHAEAFLERLPDYDSEIQARYEEASGDGKRLRYVARLGVDGSAAVGLEAVDADHPFSNINLTDNIVQFETDRYSANPLVVQGPGAGPEVTAGGVFGDLLRLAQYLSPGA